MRAEFLRFGSVPLSFAGMRDVLRRIFAVLVALAFLGGSLAPATLLPCRMSGGMQMTGWHAGNGPQTHHEQAPSSIDHDIACSSFCASGFAFTTPDLLLEVTL